MKNTINVLTLMFCFTVVTQSQTQLFITDALSGTNFNLTIKTGSVNFYSGFNTNTLGVNGNYLGPTLILRKDDYILTDVTQCRRIGSIPSKNPKH